MAKSTKKAAKTKTTRKPAKVGKRKTRCTTCRKSGHNARTCGRE